MGIRPFSRIRNSLALPLAVMLAASPPAAALGASLQATPGGSANTLNEGLTLRTAITVEADVVTLGDVFEGFLSRPEKVVARAPKPGQRLTLSAEQLTDIARTYGLDWRPAGSFDRAIVYQPGQTLTGADILGAVKAALVAQGMPANYGIQTAAPVAPVTVARSAPRDIGVREAVYHENARQFSAVVQIPPNDPQAVFVALRGTAFPTVHVPVLKEATGKNTTITAEMIDIVAFPQDQMKPATLTDPGQLIGKTPKTFLKAGQPIRDSEVTQITLVEIPVLTTDIDRNSRITGNQITIAAVNAASVPADAVSAPEYLIGKSPRRPLAAGVPIRRADVTVLRQVEVPVAARDLPRGTVMTEDDITWVTMNEDDLVGRVVTDEAAILGQVTRLTVKAGQPLRAHSIAKPIAVERGQAVVLLWSAASINLTAQAQAMEKGGVGDVIRVTNTKSNQTVLAEIIDARTVRVAAPDQISAR